MESTLLSLLLMMFSAINMATTNTFNKMIYKVMVLFVLFNDLSQIINVYGIEMISISSTFLAFLWHIVCSVCMRQMIISLL
jgi:predicted glycosyltransferase